MDFSWLFGMGQQQQKQQSPAFKCPKCGALITGAGCKPPGGGATICEGCYRKTQTAAPLPASGAGIPLFGWFTSLWQQPPSQAQTIQSQMQQDAQRQQADRWRTQQDTQTKIFEVTQDATYDPQRVAYEKAVEANYADWHH